MQETMTCEKKEGSVLKGKGRNRRKRTNGIETEITDAVQRRSSFADKSDNKVCSARAEDAKESDSDGEHPLLGRNSIFAQHLRSFRVCHSGGREENRGFGDEEGAEEGGEPDKSFEFRIGFAEENPG
jgi:hypothetical protein